MRTFWLIFLAVFVAWDFYWMVDNIQDGRTVWAVVDLICGLVMVGLFLSWLDRD